MDVALGMVVAGRYKVVEPLGRGGMGAVYRVEHVHTGEKLALKVLIGAARFDPPSLARFKREAKASARIGSEHVVRVTDADTAPELGNAPFLVMELLHGTDLERHAIDHGPLEPHVVVSILAQVARALSKAHALGIIHRDLKPENLFLHERADGTKIAKVLDFGISKYVANEAVAESGAMTSTNSVIGTPLYMAPEQAQAENDKVDATTDVWSLGLVAMRLLMGESYWGTPTLMDLMMKLVVKPIVPPSERWPKKEPQSTALDAWFLRSCDRDQTKRFRSVDEQIAELASALGVELTEKLPPITITPPQRSEEAGLPFDTTVFDKTVAATPLAPAPAKDEAVTQLEGSAPKPSRRFRRLGAGAMAIAGLVLAGALAPRLWSRSQRTAPEPAMPADDAVVACPIFEASGVSPPTGWLGAAAAHTACDQIGWIRGGGWTATLVPAELLDLPREPKEDFPHDPFAADGARDRSLAAARTRAAYWIDGSVTRRSAVFDVELHVHHRDGSELARASGSGTLRDAIRRALDALVERRALHRAETLKPELAQWIGLTHVEDALAVERVWDVGSPPIDACNALRLHRTRLGRREVEVAQDCEAVVPKWRDEVPILAAIDRSTPPAFALTASQIAAGNPKAVSDWRAVAGELGALRRVERSPLARAAIAAAEADAWLAASDLQRASEVNLTSIVENPRDGSRLWKQIWRTEATTSRIVLLWASMGWLPHTVAWSTLQREVPATSLPAGFDVTRRAYELQPESAETVLMFATRGLLTGNVEEAKAAAAALQDDTPERHATREYVFARVDLAQGRFGRAHERLAPLVDPNTLYVDTATAHSLIVAQYLADILGRRQTFADTFAGRVVQSSPLRPGVGLFAKQVISICLDAETKLASACIDRLERETKPDDWELPTISALLLAGGKRFVAGDMKGTVASFREGMPLTRYKTFLPARVLDVAGASELADAIDAVEDVDAFSKAFHGISPVAARMAKRAFARGDKARARELAQRVVDAWATTDVAVPAVAEMRTILDRTR